MAWELRQRQSLEGPKQLVLLLGAGAAGASGHRGQRQYRHNLLCPSLFSPTLSGGSTHLHIHCRHGLEDFYCFLRLLGFGGLQAGMRRQGALRAREAADWRGAGRRLLELG